MIVRSARTAMSGRQPARVIVSGSGAFLASDICPSVQRVNLSEELGPAVSSAACAFAVAKLLQTQLSERTGRVVQDNVASRGTRDT
jgi:uncharacterized hydantoinase/oxoprolinase family protein